MLEEHALLKSLLTRNSFNKYYNSLTKLNLEPEYIKILKAIHSYYETYTELLEINLEELKLYLKVLFPGMKDYSLLYSILDSLSDIEIQDNLLSDYINILIERQVASEIVEKLTPVLDGSQKGIVESLTKELSEYRKKLITRLDPSDNSLFVNQNLTDLLNEEVLKKGISWRLGCLNTDLGPLRGGSLGHVFARVDTGKTSFLASEATHLAEQLSDDEVLLWFNNEEKGTKVQLRLYSASLNATKQQLAEYPDRASQKFARNQGDKILLYDNAIITIDDIDSILASRNVRIVIIDQGDKVKFHGDGGMATHERLKALYGKFRELAKKYGCDIITAGQANFEAEDKQWLSLTNMDNSKTGKPGELDYAIGIGALSEPGHEFVRFIHLCKNKMHDGVHGKHTTLFNPLTARYSDAAQSPIERLASRAAG